MTLPETCGAAGGAISMLVKIMGFHYGGIISTYSDCGIVMWCVGAVLG